MIILLKFYRNVFNQFTYPKEILLALPSEFLRHFVPRNDVKSFTPDSQNGGNTPPFTHTQKKDLVLSRSVRLNKKRELYTLLKYFNNKKLRFLIHFLSNLLHFVINTLLCNNL